MRKNKGVTLITLIITIIVLLILVGVSINLIIKGDLFGNAEKAVDGTNAKVEQEQTRVDELMGELEKVQIDYKVENIQYTENAILICVYTDNSEISFKYDDNLMYDITDSGYKYNGITFEKVFGYIILDEFDKAKIEKQEGVDNVEKLVYDGDCNLDQELTLRDAMLISEMLANKITLDNSSEKKFLKADYNKDKRMTQDDAEDIMNFLGGN